MSRQVLRAILFALPQTLNLAAARFPAFRARLRQRDVVGWIGLQDGSIGRIVEMRNGRVRSRSGAASEAQVTMTFKDVATALKLLLPNRDQGEIIHAAKNFKVVTAGPDDLVVWFTQTLNMSETAGLAMGTPMPDGSRRYTTCTNGGPLVRLCQGRPDPAGHADRVRRHRPGHLGDRGPRPQVQPAPPRPRGATCPDDEVAGLLGQAHPSSDEAGGF